MANEIKTNHTKGSNLYLIILNPSGSIWNGSSFVTIEADNWSNYAINGVEQDNVGIYFFNFPAAINLANKYILIAYERSGDIPAITDLPIKIGEILWSGTEETSGNASLSLGTIEETLDKLYKIVRALKR